MRVPLHVVQARREKLAALIERHRYLPVGELCRRLGVSEATARRDLAALVRSNKIKRTHGGALSEFNDRFPSFNERQRTSQRSKAEIGAAALRLMRPEGVYFLDSGTTIFALAEAFRERPVVPVSIVTSNIPAGELLSSVPNVRVFLVAGQILGRQSVILGDAACRSMEFWNFDMAFLSAEAANGSGIWNTQEIIVQQQLAAIRRSTRVVYCIDKRKIGSSAPYLLLRWPEVDCLLTDASPAAVAACEIPEEKVIGTRGDGSIPEIEPPRPQIPIHFL